MQTFKTIVEEVKDNLGRGHSQSILGCQGELKLIFQVYLANLAQKSWGNKNIVFVYPNNKSMEQARYQFASFWGPNGSLPLNLGHWKFWGTNRYSVKASLVNERVQTLATLSDAGPGQVIFATLNGLMAKTLPMQRFKALSLRLTSNAIWDQDEICSKLDRLSYTNVDKVEEVGQYAVRGGILDVYTPGYSSPHRLEWIADMLASIRAFDPTAQVSIEDSLRDHLTISPCLEFEVSEDNRLIYLQKLHEIFLAQECRKEDRQGILSAFEAGYVFSELNLFGPVLRSESSDSLDYIQDQDILCFMDPLELAFEAAKNDLVHFKKLFQKDLDMGRPTLSPDYHYNSQSTPEMLTSRFLVIEMGTGIQRTSFKQAIFKERWRSTIDEISNKDKIIERFPAWIRFWNKRLGEDYRIIIFFASDQIYEKIGHLLDLRKIPHFRLEESLPELGFLDPGVFLIHGEIQGYYLLEQSKFLLLDSSEILSSSSKSESARGKGRLKEVIESYKELNAGDFVVHEEHGIARFLGLVKIDRDLQGNDYLELEFGGADKLYLPIDRVGSLQKYQASSKDVKPRLDRLKGNQWIKRKSKAQKSAKDIAEKLIAAKAQRKSAIGVKYSLPSEMYFEFESGFPYDETIDQIAAINDVNNDLSSSHPMDRLICGDVGFGKTEVALRAAMRVVLDGYQVMIVVPTTVLCFQHYMTFYHRFEQFGVNVDYVSRFVPSKKTREMLAHFRKGKIDILIGTHRILSKDVKPLRLGLLIVDEEQRFGVEQKEMISGLADGCDLLTLTATPIPRTLHMSLMGLKDISLIMTPPRLRLPIETYVAPFDESVVLRAIDDEVARGGQVFFVHNKVYDIDGVGSFLASLRPNLHVEVAHGQLSAAKLEKVMLDVLKGNVDVLICTTIVESGIDIPNVNTLIINNADKFGLSQLYQIKGRIGRGSRQAFCYLMYSSHGELTPEAHKRLEVLASHKELGAGFYIASHDLELRGAGNLLGAEQSGHVDGVGFELFTQMVEQSLRCLEDSSLTAPKEVEVKLPLCASIPVEYMSVEGERLKIYRRIFAAGDQRELQLLGEEIKDRFGALPLQVKRLFKVASLKQNLRALGASSIRVGRLGYLEIEINPSDSVGVGRIREAVAELSQTFKWLELNTILLNLRMLPNQGPDEQDKILQGVMEALEAVQMKLAETSGV